jgi:hypothetical protein
MWFIWWWWCDYGNCETANTMLHRFLQFCDLIGTSSKWMAMSYAEETNNCMVSKRNTTSVVAEQITGLLTLLQLTWIQVRLFLLNLHKDAKTGALKRQCLLLSHFHLYVRYQEFHHHVHLENKQVLNKVCHQPKDDPSLWWNILCVCLIRSQDNVAFHKDHHYHSQHQHFSGRVLVLSVVQVSWPCLQILE